MQHDFWRKYYSTSFESHLGEGHVEFLFWLVLSAWFSLLICFYSAYIYFPPSRMIFFWYHKVLITIWIGIFACKHLLSSNNFSQAKILQSGVKFTNSGPFVPAKTWTLSDRLFACVLNSCIHCVFGNCAKFDKFSCIIFIVYYSLLR